MSVKPKVEIYTDGACSGNPGPGGWGTVLHYGDQEKRLQGGAAQTTNNRMEIQAVIEGLKALKKPCTVNLYSDSAYVVNAFNQGWLKKWQNNGWQTSAKKPVENQDLWQALLEAAKDHEINWIKVKGHSDNHYNNICDELAVAEASKYKEA